MRRLLLGAVLLWNLGICVASQVPGMLGPPAHVRFDSVDYTNILRWTAPTNGTSLLYHVQWKIYGEPEWLDVDGCQGIQINQCDLTATTSNPREWYYARVRASFLSSSKSAWARSPRFNPCGDSTISPPVLRLNVTEQVIVVHVKPPRLLVRKLHSGLLYKIYLIHTSGEEEVFEMSCCSNKLTLKELDHNMLYCFQAQIVVPFQAKSSARGILKCVTLS